MDRLDGFDWDAANVGHILRHAVTPFEVEEVVGPAARDHCREDYRWRKKVEAFRENSQPLPGRSVHDSAEAVPHGDGL